MLHATWSLNPVRTTPVSVSYRLPWGVRFSDDDLAMARSVAGETGNIVHEEDGLILARDPDDAAFFMIG